MSKSSANSVIRLRNVRHNDLKNFDLDLPLHRLTVVTGLSASGKSPLAFGQTLTIQPRLATVFP